MNIYHKEFHPEFIKELPVDFNKMKNIDLTTIPSEYHLLFTTDWNWGRHSTMPMDQRMILQQMYLDFMSEEVKNKIYNRNKKQESPVVGFPKD
jgi:hypothetical protein